MTGMDFYIPIPSHSHAVISHSFPFSFPSLSLIPIPWYSHKVIPISKHAQQKKQNSEVKCKPSIVEQQKKFHRKIGGHQLLTNKKVLKNTTNILKIKQMYFSRPSQCYVCCGGMAQLCTN